MAELTTDNVLRRDIPWETYMTTKLITGTGLQLLRRYDKKDSSKAQLLDDDGPSYIRVFVSILRDISKEETVEYVLALIDEMLTANPNRARLFHDKSLSNEDTYEPFLKLLLKSNWFIQEKSCKILSLIVSARPKVQNGYSANGDYSDSKKKLTTIDDVLNGLVQWLCAQLKKPFHPTRGTPTAVHCLATLLKEPFVRSSFVQADGVKLLAPSITAASIQQSMQHLYETCLCIWLLSYYVPAVENLATVKVDGKTVLQKLIDVVKGSTKERVVRVVVLTLRNLLDKGNFGAQMADLDVLQVVQSLKSQAWSDEDLLESLNQLEVGLKENIKQLSSFDKYKQEVLLGNLKWSPMHKDPAFWRENITSFEDSDFQILKCDRGKRTVINVLGDDETLAKSDLLTREEVLRRRLRRVKNLSKIYRDMYWTYMEELKVKHREYYWVYGKSPFQEEDESSKGENGEATFQDNGDQGNRCGVHGCKSKAMALTKFCQMHILSDSHQKLYKPCNFAIKSSQTGPILCGKPILRSTVPSYCTLHFQKAEKDVAKALKKAGLSVSATTKLAPKFHVVVSEYVRQIQTKRKEARKREIARTINDVEEDISC